MLFDQCNPPVQIITDVIFQNDPGKVDIYLVPELYQQLIDPICKVFYPHSPTYACVTPNELCCVFLFPLRIPTESKQLNEFVQIEWLLNFLRIAGNRGDIVVDTDREEMLSCKPTDPKQGRMICTGSFTHRQIRKIIVSGHHFPDPLPDSGKFLHTLHNEINRTEIRAVETTDERMNAIQFLQPNRIICVFSLIVDDG